RCWSPAADFTSSASATRSLPVKDRDACPRRRSLTLFAVAGRSRGSGRRPSKSSTVRGLIGSAPEAPRPGSRRSFARRTSVRVLGQRGSSPMVLEHCLRVLLVVVHQFLVELRVLLLHLRGLLEKALRGHGEELGRLGGSIMIEDALPSVVARLAQLLVF